MNDLFPPPLYDHAYIVKRQLTPFAELSEIHIAYGARCEIELRIAHAREPVYRSHEIVAFFRKLADAIERDVQS